MNAPSRSNAGIGRDGCFAVLARGHLRSVVGVGRSRFASLLQHGLTGKLYSAAAEKTGEKKAKE
ncbi:MAG: hypothetical protein ACLFO1_05035, partial [Spirochaetaceae bacterium]